MSTQRADNTHRSISVRFGDAVLQEGHTAVPNLVLKHYAGLGITPTEMMFIIHVWQFWWTERQPFPSLGTIAQRMAITRRQVRKYTQSLKEKGLLEVRDRFSPTLGQMSSEYDFSPLLRAVVAQAQDEDPEADSQAMIDTPPRNNPSEGGRNSSSEGRRNRSSSEEDTLLNKTQKEEDLHNSNIRMAQRRGKKGIEAQRPPSEAPSTTTAGASSVGDILSGGRVQRPGRGRPETATDEWQAIQAYVIDLARELGDGAPLKSSTTRAYNLFVRSGRPLSDFVGVLYQARSLTQEQTASITKTTADGRGPKRKAKMAYFFAVLEQLLGFREPPVPGPRNGSASPDQAPPTSGTRPRDTDGPYGAYIKR